MKAKDLAKELMKTPEHDVILSSDPEGNVYNKMEDGNLIKYFYDDFDNEIKLGEIELTEELRLMNYTEEDILSKSAKPCVVIYP
tara:strand:+ start:42651 stop:42902 length:252 start_codon:yes stop_codon:yes gene_type:complete